MNKLDTVAQRFQTPCVCYYLFVLAGRAIALAIPSPRQHGTEVRGTTRQRG